MTVEADLETAVAAIEAAPPADLTNEQRNALSALWKRLARAIGTR